MPKRKILTALAILLTGVHIHAEITTDAIPGGEMTHWAGDFQSIVGLHYASMGYDSIVFHADPDADTGTYTWNYTIASGGGPSTSITRSVVVYSGGGIALPPATGVSPHRAVTTLATYSDTVPPVGTVITTGAIGTINSIK